MVEAEDGGDVEDEKDEREDGMGVTEQDEAEEREEERRVGLLLSFPLLGV